MDKKAVDHVPVGFWHHFGGEEAAGEACVKAHLDYCRSVDTDLIKIMSDGYFEYPLSVKIEQAADWYKLKPLGKDHPYLKEQYWRVKRIKEELGDDAAIFYNVNAPFSSIRNGAGDELIMRHLREDKDAILFALDVIAADNAAICEMVIADAKADGIYYPVQGAELFRFSPDEYRELISPSDLFVLNRANELSDYNILHMCGWAGDRNRLEVWRDYPVKTVNWAIYVEDVSLEQGREYFGKKSVLGGFKNTRPAPLFYGTRDEVRTFTHELIKSFGKIGLLIGGDCTIPAEVPPERIKWVVDAAREI